ncbi:NADPH:quinone reductase [Humibacter sp. RRB41]|uniref:NADPH:quinone reductase n=1 Tax=Humibacter sp. RRB41 TaxID=2919946 RepID=UPI001FA9D8B5|nr:NADPH:quinone reductase [Humibacter sp. RRB41]
MTPGTMRAAVINECGPAESIHVAQIPMPEPSPSEVLVRVGATTVNHVDTFVRSGAYRTAMTFPFVVGRDLVGTVERVGDSVDGFRRGDAVWCTSLGHHGRQGAAAEFAVVPADRLYPVPDGVDPIALVAIAHPASTAWLGIVEHGGLAAHGTAFVGGGGGNVGGCAVGIAAGAGAHVVTTVGEGDVSRLDEAGSVAIDYRASDLDERVTAALPNGADVWFDTSGMLRLAQAVPLLAERGRIVLIAGISRHDDLAFGDLYTQDRSIVGFAISNATVDELRRASDAVGTALAAGDLPSPPIDRLSLEQTADAHAALEAGDARGRRFVIAP